MMPVGGWDTYNLLSGGGTYNLLPIWPINPSSRAAPAQGSEFRACAVFVFIFFRLFGFLGAEFC